MSGFVGALVGTGVAAGVDALTNILIQPTRQIGTIFPDCAIEEVEHDRLVVTQHPIENGASITDHVYKLPTEIHLRWGWSNSAPANGILSVIDNGIEGFDVGGIGGAIGGALFGSETYVKDVYYALRKLQVSGVPFSLTTGKRQYNNCVLTSLSVHTDERTEYALICEATVTEIIIVSTQTTKVPLADQAAQAPHTKADTSPQIDRGIQSLQETNKSILDRIANIESMLAGKTTPAAPTNPTGLLGGT